MKPTSIILISLLTLSLDQLSKRVVIAYGTYITNTGAAFGILQHYQTFLIFLALAVIIIIFASLRNYPYPELGLILGGSAGNLLDRILYGHVIDFITIGWWPSFNLADTANTIGALLLLIRFARR